MLKIAIVGRANVGKSTLFNALVGKKIAIVEDIAGVTRDRKYAKASLFDLDFNIIDTGGFEEDALVSVNKDTPKKTILNKNIWQQATYAIKEADIVLFMADARDGITLADTTISVALRKHGKPVILVLNKTDTKGSKKNITEFSELGFAEIVEVSSTHKIGFSDLYDKINELIAQNNIIIKEELSEKPELMLAFVGKPNVGKSTMINNLLKQERVVTSDIAGTTRDSIYLDFFYEGKKIKLVDTAGLRRRSKVDYESLEQMANSDTIQTINFANVVAIVIDATEGLAKQDLTIAQHVYNEGRGLIFIVNKIDLIKQKAKFIEELKLVIEEKFFQIKDPYIITISAFFDKDITSILDASLELYEKWKFEISTSKLNEWVKFAVSKNSPPSVNGRVLKIKYATQTKKRPPTIALWSNFKNEFDQGYLRYLHNVFVKTFKLQGCTVRFVINKSANPFEGKPNPNNHKKK
jgi:GTP-binding protein